jgi:hypothetical protein
VEEDRDKFVPLNEFEQFVESRRQEFDAMIWQVPGLSVAAQAFLYLVALNPAASSWVRIFAGVLGIVAALATVQLLVKHRYHEETYAETIDASRTARGAHAFRGVEWFKETASTSAEATEAPRSGYARRYGPHAWRRKVAAPSSVGVWTWTLVAFAIGDALIVLGALLDLCGALHPFD